MTDPHLVPIKSNGDTFVQIDFRKRFNPDNIVDITVIESNGIQYFNFYEPELTFAGTRA